MEQSNEVEKTKLLSQLKVFKEEKVEIAQRLEDANIQLVNLQVPPPPI